MTSAPLRLLSPGESVPWFTTGSIGNPVYQFSTVAGRHVVLFFVGSLGIEVCAAIHHDLLARRDLFDDNRCSLFIVTADEADVRLGRAKDSLPGVRVLLDYSGAVAKQFGLLPEVAGAPGRVVPGLVLLDPSLRVMTWFVPSQAVPNPSASLMALIEALPHPLTGESQIQAPVAIIPRVFEPEFCRELIAYYDRMGGHDSGYMRHEADGIRGVIDYSRKRRSDCTIEDADLRKAIAARVHRRLKPEVQRIFRFDATRMERYIVVCYDAEVGGYFKPHRDNDGEGHRQFAVTLNLNTEDYDGGDLRFPEYGLLTYRAPTGGACVFSCGLMHEATPVTRGRRYAFVPFLYDEASAAKREANNAKYPDPKHHYYRSAAPVVKDETQ